MALYTIADLHLACSVDKPMDIFGGRWQNYMEKLRTRWQAVVNEQDTVVIGGDFSWGIDFKQSKADFAYLNALPGRKIILKGNHDLWWNTVRKMEAFLEENEFQNIYFLHNNSFSMKIPRFAAHAGGSLRRISRKAMMRRFLSGSFCVWKHHSRQAKPQEQNKSTASYNYPPIYANFRCGEIIALMQKYGVSRCIMDICIRTACAGL